MRKDNFIKPKIKEIQKYQKELADELVKLKQDGELLPSMFRAEAQFRNKCKQEKDEALVEKDQAIKNYNRLL